MVVGRVVDGGAKILVQGCAGLDASDVAGEVTNRRHPFARDQNRRSPATIGDVKFLLGILVRPNFERKMNVMNNNGIYLAFRLDLLLKIELLVMT